MPRDFNHEETGTYCSIWGGISIAFSLRIDRGPQLGACIQIFRIDGTAGRIGSARPAATLLLFQPLGTLHDDATELARNRLLRLLGEILRRQHLALLLLLERTLQFRLLVQYALAAKSSTGLASFFGTISPCASVMTLWLELIGRIIPAPGPELLAVLSGSTDDARRCCWI
uniref:Uncharacterized protein n=1 Tax=Anopheles culicifacies TaxID=139723 RepID=A0A182LVL8_9DIPT